MDLGCTCSPRNLSGYGPVKTSTIPALLCASLLLFLAGCGRIAHASYLSNYDREISSATHAIDSARDNAARAAAYTQRGSAYSEKARYSRAFNLIPKDEYDRLFGLAIKDHDQAVALDPGSGDAYYSRGIAYYDRANLETVVNGELVASDADLKTWFAPAVADFQKATEKDGHNFMTWDYLGLTHESAGELDEAISAYSREMTLNHLGKSRLADAYCARGGSDQKAKQADAVAIADYEKSIEIGVTADGCSCDPYNPLFLLYSRDGQYDQAWAVVHNAQKSKKWIDPDLLNILKKQSGRTS
jgi:tetratricopeptide (TPR) repeat protein